MKICLIFVISILFLFIIGCGKNNSRTANNSKDTIAIQLKENTLSNDEIQVGGDISSETVDTMIINQSYFDTKKGKKIRYSDSEYSKYGIPFLNTLGMTSEERFIYDDIHISFSIITEIKLYGESHFNKRKNE